MSQQYKDAQGSKLEFISDEEKKKKDSQEELEMRVLELIHQNHPHYYENYINKNQYNDVSD